MQVTPLILEKVGSVICCVVREFRSSFFFKLVAEQGSRAEIRHLQVENAQLLRFSGCLRDAAVTGMCGITIYSSWQVTHYGNSKK